MKMFSHWWHYLAQFFLEWKMFEIKIAEEIKVYLVCSVTFSRKLYPLWDTVEKFGGAREAADYNIAARCMLH